MGLGGGRVHEKLRALVFWDRGRGVVREPGAVGFAKPILLFKIDLELAGSRMNPRSKGES